MHCGCRRAVWRSSQRPVYMDTRECWQVITMHGHERTTAHWIHTGAIACNDRLLAGWHPVTSALSLAMGPALLKY